jgi:hypothetical protein
VNQSVAKGVVDRTGNSGVAIPKRVDGDPAGKIQISLSFCIYQLDAFSSNELHRSAFVGRQ